MNTIKFTNFIVAIISTISIIVLNNFLPSVYDPYYIYVLLWYIILTQKEN